MRKFFIAFSVALSAIVIGTMTFGVSRVRAIEGEITYTGSGTQIYGDDGHGGGAKGPFNIGFTFDFYGTDYTQANININGVLTFGAYYTNFTNDALNTSGQGNSIFAFWDDLITSIAMDASVQPIYYATIGEDGSRKFIVQWTNMYFFGTDIQMGTFQAILYEGDNDIQIQYRDLLGGTRALGDSATIGIKKDNATYSQYSNNTASLTEGQAIRYSSDGEGGYTVDDDADYELVYLVPHGAPASPTLVNPANGTTGVTTTPTFEWLPVEYASTYTVLVSLVSSFSSTVVNESGLTDVAYTLGSSLNESTQYYWRVQAVNGTGSSLSATRTFTTGLANTAPNTPTGVTSANLLGGASTTDASGATLTATLSDDDDSEQVRFRIQIATDAAFNDLVVDYRSPFQGEGSATFTVGEIGGTYLVGSGGTILTIDDYYLRIRTEDDAAASSSWYAPVGVAFSVIPDSTAPVISSIAASAGSGSAMITWTTDESGSSLVQYDTIEALGYTTIETNTSPRVTAHSVTLSGLPACTRYFFRPLSRDAAGNTGTGSTTGFNTSGCTASATVESQTGSSVTTGGGSLSLTNNGSGATLTVPSNAATNTFTLQIKKLDTDTVIASTSSPSGVSVIGDHTYDFRAISGSTLVTSFSGSIIVVMKYTDAQVSGYDESTLWIYRWDGSSWKALSSCVVDQSLNTVTCTTVAFSTFGLFGSALSTGDATTNAPSQQGSGGRRGSVAGMNARISAAQESLLARLTSTLRRTAAEEAVDESAGEGPIAVGKPTEEEIRKELIKLQETAQESVADEFFLSHFEYRGKILAHVEGVPVVYDDVPADAWFAPYIVALVDQGVAIGYADEQGKPKGEFGVGNPITVAEFLKMAFQAAGESVAGLPLPRNRSALGSWASAYIAKAEVLGLVAPDCDIDVPVTRGQAVWMILKIFKLPVARQMPQFSDVPADYPYANAIATAAFYGLITGDRDTRGNPLNTFRPDKQINRAESAKMIAVLRKMLESK